MIVAIQSGLDDIKVALEKKGYTVKYKDECFHPVSAYIYNEENRRDPFQSVDMHLGNVHIGHGEAPFSSQTKEINIRHKTIDEIEWALQEIYHSDRLF